MWSREMKPGDRAITDYNSGRYDCVVTIVERTTGHSQSGVMYRVTPALRNGNLSSWYDADWFTPLRPVEQSEIAR